MKKSLSASAPVTILFLLVFGSNAFANQFDSEETTEKKLDSKESVQADLQSDLCQQIITIPTGAAKQKQQKCEIFWRADLNARVSFTLDRGEGPKFYECSANAIWDKFPIALWDSRQHEFEHCYFDYMIELGWHTPSYMESNHHQLGICNDGEVEEFAAATLGIQDNWDLPVGDPKSILLQLKTSWLYGGYHCYANDYPLGDYLDDIRNRRPFTVEIKLVPDPGYDMPADYAAWMSLTFRPVD